jgi:hypothetical protein
VAQRGPNSRRPVAGVLDETTAFGTRAAGRLREERIAWLTTVAGD